MFPLKTRKLIRGSSAHVAAGLGIAADYEADFAELYLPFNGSTQWVWGTEGGWWYKVTRENGDRIEMAHNSQLITLDAQEGNLIAITGNTGSITTGPHLHIQIFDKNNNRLDPEKYDWGQEVNMGFDDKQMRGILENSFRTQRKTLLGKVNETDLQADCDFRLAQIKKGSVTAAAEQFDTYVKAQPPVVCPPPPECICAPCPSVCDDVSWFKITIDKLRKLFGIQQS